MKRTVAKQKKLLLN